MFRENGKVSVPSLLPFGQNGGVAIYLSVPHIYSIYSEGSIYFMYSIFSIDSVVAVIAVVAVVAVVPVVSEVAVVALVSVVVVLVVIMVAKISVVAVVGLYTLYGWPAYCHSLQIEWRGYHPHLRSERMEMCSAASPVDIMEG